MYPDDLAPAEIDKGAAGRACHTQVAARLKALEETALPPVRWIWAVRAHDPGVVADALVRYAYTYDRAARRAVRSDVEKALCFKLWTETAAGQPQVAAQ